MNKGNLNKLISNYIANFNFINDKHMEYYKWEAVKYFQDHWDIDAPDFASMLKECLKESYNLINNKVVQPANGIIKLAEKPELTEVIRQMFKDLLADDNGDIDKRQDKIDAFLDKSQKLIEKYYKGSWKYNQSRGTVILYLSFIEPDKNYMFKSEQAKEFMYCTEFGKNFGCGENFSLKTYYEMCDEVVEAIKATPELIELHRGRMTEKMWPDDNYHILAYDIIYSSTKHISHNDISFVKPTNSRAQTREKQAQAKREELAADLERLNTELIEARSERAEYDEFSLNCLEVTHKKYGEGTVVSQSGSSLKVRFGEQEIRFEMPKCFLKGFLKTDTDEVADMFKEIAALDEKIEKYNNMIQAAKYQLNMNK